MTSRVSDLSRVPRQAIIKAHGKIFEELLSFAPGKIKMAPDRIARLRGYPNYQYLEDYHHMLRMLDAPKPFDDPTLDKSDRTKLDQFLLQSPRNYMRVPDQYLPIEMTIRLLLGSKRALKGLQLAANYGPYLLYLKEKRGFTNFFGIDIDQYAVAYAREIGNPVIAGNAANLPFAGSSFDLVISDHFLAIDYLFLAIDYLPLGMFSQMPVFIRAVAGEVHRVLKPGGYFISLDECVHLDPDIPFSPPQAYSAEVSAAFSGLKNLKVFQKA